SKEDERSLLCDVLQVITELKRVYRQRKINTIRFESGAPRHINSNIDIYSLNPVKESTELLYSNRKSSKLSYLRRLAGKKSFDTKRIDLVKNVAPITNGDCNEELATFEKTTKRCVFILYL
ncbi:hypothetical protein Ciccas_001163, partial [Cichlidogyrus casuarinus]